MRRRWAFARVVAGPDGPRHLAGKLIHPSAQHPVRADEDPEGGAGEQPEQGKLLVGEKGSEQRAEYPEDPGHGGAGW